MARRINAINNVVGGYLVDFCTPLSDEFVCSICFLAFKDPVQAPCGHQFCKTCWDYWSNSTIGSVAQCPLDRQNIELDKVFPDRAIQKKVLALKVKCKNYCEWTGELRSLQDHIQVCPLDFIHCTNKGCRVPVRRRNLTNHVTQECYFRRLACIFCSEIYVFKDTQIHHEVCKSLPVECINGCSTKDIKRNKMELHLQSCPLANLPCRYEDVGCQFTGTKHLRDVHEVTAVQDHLTMAMEQLKIQSQRTENAIQKKSAILKLNKDVEFQYGQKRITIKSWRMQEKMIW